MKNRALLISLIILLVILVLQWWQPWQRDPAVFYEPLILPIETIEGDIIVMADGKHIVIRDNQRINSMDYQNNTVSMNVTKHKSLWDIIME